MNANIFSYLVGILIFTLLLYKAGFKEKSGSSFMGKIVSLVISKQSIQDTVPLDPCSQL